MTDTPSEYSIEDLERMNEKTIKNQLFTPDTVYIELGLFKDIPLGCILYPTLVDHDDDTEFKSVQEKIAEVVFEYQTRRYDTIEECFGKWGYTDTYVDEMVKNTSIHDTLFLVSPNTKFLYTLMKHTIRNQNNSKPAEKFNKKYIDKTHYRLEPIDVTYRINTYPLTLSNVVLEPMARELGEILGVNIAFMNKDPSTFDQSDWDSWMDTTDCFYIESIGRFQRSTFTVSKQSDMEFIGKYLFVRKRFEKSVMVDMVGEDFEQQIQIHTAIQDILCDFNWLQNNDSRLTEEAEDVSMNDDEEISTEDINDG